MFAANVSFTRNYTLDIADLLQLSRYEQVITKNFGLLSPHLQRIIEYLTCVHCTMYTVIQCTVCIVFVHRTCDSCGIFTEYKLEYHRNRVTCSNLVSCSVIGN